MSKNMVGLKFAFVSNAAEREYKDLPSDVQDEFGKDLRRIQFNQDPVMEIKHLSSVGQGIIELIINGSPAYRCIYCTKYMNAVVVLHSFVKTTNGIDQQAMKTAKSRLTELMEQSKQQ